ncbi:T-complex protein 1 subunit delta, partial [Trifolium pratense]
WDFLKQEYEGNEKIKGMQVLNLIREFEMQHMKEFETIKEYSDKLLSIVNNVRLHGTEFSDTRIVQKILVTVPERFESTISSLENSKDLSNITLSELVYALQAQEQRRLMREEGTIEGSSKGEDEKANNPPCQHCGKTNHPHFKCWSRPNFRCNKCNQQGHIAKFCKTEVQPRVEAQVADQNEEEDYLFATTCLSTDKNNKNWLVDIGCTHHMAHDEELFKELDKTIASKVTIRNGESVDVKGKGVVALETLSCTKYISDVLFVPELKQNMLSVGQMLEKHYTLHFNDMKCTIFDPVGCELMSIKMRNRSFPIEWKKTAIHASPSVVEASNKEMKELSSMDGWRVVIQEKKNMKEKNESWQFEDKPRD